MPLMSPALIAHEQSCSSSSSPSSTGLRRRDGERIKISVVTSWFSLRHFPFSRSRLELRSENGSCSLFSAISRSRSLLLVFHVRRIFNAHAAFHAHVDFQNGEADLHVPKLSPRSTVSPIFKVANVESASGDGGSEVFTFAAPARRKLWKRNYRDPRGRNNGISGIFDFQLSKFRKELRRARRAGFYGAIRIEIGGTSSGGKNFSSAGVPGVPLVFRLLPRSSVEKYPWSEIDEQRERRGREKVVVPRNKQFITFRDEDQKRTIIAWNATAATRMKPDDDDAKPLVSCLIQGSIYFIFGNGRTLCQACTLSIIAKKFGAVAAQQNQSSDEEPEFVFIGCYVNVERSINGPGVNSTRLVPWSKNLTVDEVEPHLGQNYVNGMQ
ncbi:protein MpCE8.4 [Marchantia polymorpha subsp. ruderalis]|uniref:Uncharacterized protein n=1 Tax=Marchantia polymorpha TaxID=3197 RepID=A0A2R6XCP9_MARPO|nr:hypothetical protein MARPO_0023s0179 [Marchantia polymorpha]BBN02025.1 hypothetical protein Mp_2g12150 [Marchantia polymorpha subsp. ruderalis]|eukprot:PTQ43888.1 hypothetical protein MARPO_0023s0179 [Marchantia polymorpha]